MVNNDDNNSFLLLALRFRCPQSPVQTAGHILLVSFYLRPSEMQRLIQHSWKWQKPASGPVSDCVPLGGGGQSKIWNLEPLFGIRSKITAFTWEEGVMKGLQRCGWPGIHRPGLCTLAGQPGCGTGLGIHKGGAGMPSDM